jgi:hypothetical protein
VPGNPDIRHTCHLDVLRNIFMKSTENLITSSGAIKTPLFCKHQSDNICPLHLCYCYNLYDLALVLKTFSLHSLRRKNSLSARRKRTFLFNNLNLLQE